MTISPLSAIVEIEKHRLDFVPPKTEGDPAFLPIHLTGGFGDGILARSTLYRLKAEGYRCVVYTPHAEALRPFYRGAALVEGRVPNYTWHLELDSIARFFFGERFSGFLLHEHRALFEQQRKVLDQNPRLALLLREHPERKYLLTRLAEEAGHSVETLPQVCLGFNNPARMPPETRKPPRDYITVHDGFDPNCSSLVSGRATKQWPAMYWEDLVEMIHLAAPTLRIIQIGSDQDRPIAGVDECLVGQTTLSDALTCLSESLLHIDNDSGLVHAGAAMGVPSVVLFGPTPSGFYGHRANTNICSRSSCEGNCFFLTPDWMNRCPVGLSSPLCMKDIAPVIVFQAVQELLQHSGSAVARALSPKRRSSGMKEHQTNHSLPAFRD